MKTKLLIILLSCSLTILSACTKSGDSTVSTNFLGKEVAQTIVLQELQYNVQEDSSLLSLLEDQQAASIGQPAVNEYKVVVQPKYGTLTLDKDGHFSYVPMANFIGQDLFKYEVVIKGKTYNNVVKLNVMAVNDAPVLLDSEFTTDEDTILNSSLNSLDVDSVYLNYQLVQSTSNGYITLLPSGSFIYIPFLNFNGTDTFKAKVNDGELDSEVKTFSIEVKSVNDIPVANALTFGVNAGSIHTGQLLATDADSNSLTYTLVSQGTKGLVVLNPLTGAFSYSANIGTSGNDTFTYRVNDSQVSSQVVTVTAVINPVNVAPVSLGLNVETSENVSVSSTLSTQVSDANGDSVTYQVLTAPLFGTLDLDSQTGQFTYTPNAHYHGPDSFTYQANDGQFDSNLSVVTINVLSVNDAPTNVDSTVTVLEDAVLNNQLVSSDVDNDTLSFYVSSQPEHGLLTLNLNGSYTYVPNLNYNGPDSFTYISSDSLLSSSVTTVSITVTPVNDTPVANMSSLSVIEDSAASGQVSGSDIDGDTLTFVVDSYPTKGTLSWNSTGSYTYTPNPNVNGFDSFTFKSFDGQLYSTAATVSITISNTNDAPEANDTSLVLNEDSVGTKLLTGSDLDGNVLTYSLVDAPDHGSATINSVTGLLTYTPNANYYGTDSLTFKVNDGNLNSNQATLSIVVNSVNDQPVADIQTISVNRNSSKAFVLTGSDIDGDSLTYTVVTSPLKGTLSGTPPNLTYTPGFGEIGSDVLTFKVNDGTIDSSLSTVTINIVNSNSLPQTSDVDKTLNEDTTSGGTLTATDSDNDILTYTIVTNPTKGSVVLNSTTGIYVYTPNLNANGTDSFTYKATDGFGDSNISTVTFTITPVNDAPTTSNNTLAVVEDTPKADTLTAVDVDGNSLTYTIVTNPTKGTVSLNSSTGAFTYTPDLDAIGNDSFTFKANDGTVDSNVSTISIVIGGENDAPVSSNGSLTINEDTVGNGTLVSSDVDGDSLTYSIVSQGSKGTVSVNSATGAYTYTPNLNANGSDSFTFRTNDGQFNSNTATISVTITPVNDAPIANDSSLNVTEDVVANSSVTASDVDGNSLTYAVVVAPTKGTVVLNASTGTYSYTPNANAIGADSFTFRANDGTVNSNTATVSIIISPTNDAPTTSNGSLTTIEDTVGNGTLSAADLDGDTLTYSIVTSPTKGTLSLNAATGAYTYTPNLNENGADSFTFRVNDGTTNSNTSTVSITITPVNDAPVSSNLALTVTEDTPKVSQLIATDVDNASLTYSIVTNPTKGTLTLNAATGDFTYTPNANAEGADSFTFKTNDGLLNSNTATVSITITPVNDSPTTSNGTLTINEDTVGNGTLIATDLDGNTLTYSVVGQGSKGTVSVNASTGAYTYTPNANANGSDTFTFKVNDGTTDSNTSTISVTITPVNDAPTTSNSSLTINEDNVGNSSVVASDVDGDSLTYSIVTNPTKGTVVLNASTGTYSYTPNLNSNGADSFTFRVNDGTVNSNTSTVSITVNSFNDAPISSNGSLTTNEDTVGNGTLVATDVDNASLTYSIVTSPTKGTISLNATTGAYTYTPNANVNGSDSFTFKANDGTVDSNTSTVSVTITPVNDAPVSSNGTLTVNEDSSNGGTLVSTDVDGDSLTYSIVANPTKGAVSINALTGTYTYTPNANANGSDSFTFRTTDGSLNSNTATVSVTITPVNDAPTWTSSTAITLNTNKNTAVNTTFASTDLDGDSITYSIVTCTSGTCNINNSTGLFTYTPNTNFVGTVVLTARCFDGTAYCSPNTSVTINVINPNQAPVAVAQSTMISLRSSSSSVTLSGTDSNSDPLTYTVVSSPTLGTLSGTAPNLTYTPNSAAWTNCASEGAYCSFSGWKLVKYGTVTNYLIVKANNGINCTNDVLSDPIVGDGKTCSILSTSDSFTFKVNDGQVDSSVATVTINFEEWYNTNWTRRKKLVFNYDTNSDLIDFPVLVKIDNTRIDYAQTQSNGQDLRFVDSGGTVLAHEIESWNSSGISYIWVKTTLGQMEANNHHIYMYYGNPSASDGQNAANVWSNGYVSVWHLNQTSGTVTDSVGNNNGTVSGTLTRNTAGPFGNSYTNSSASACVTIPHNSSQLFNRFTLESWAKSSTDSQTSSIIQKDILSGGNYYWAYSLENNSGRMGETLTDNSLNSTTYTTPSKYWTLNTWTYNAITYNDPSNTTVAYQNGSSVLTNSSATRGTYSGAQGNTLNIIGDCANAGFKGSVDEIRISNVERSAEWIKYQYLSMNDGLIMYGQEQIWGNSSTILNQPAYVLKIFANGNDGNVSVAANTWNSSGDAGSGVTWMGEENNQDNFGYFRFQLPVAISSSGVSNARLKIMGSDATNFGAWNSGTHYLRVSAQRSANSPQVASMVYPGSGVTDTTSKVSWNASSLNWNGTTWNVSPNLMSSINEVSSSYSLSANNYIQLWVKRGASFNCGSSSWCQVGSLDYSADSGKNAAQLLIEF